MSSIPRITVAFLCVVAAGLAPAPASCDDTAARAELGALLRANSASTPQKAVASKIEALKRRLPPEIAAPIDEYALAATLVATGDGREFAKARAHFNIPAGGQVERLCVQKCASCGGRGKFTAACSACGHSGRCPTCRGSGKVYRVFMQSELTPQRTGAATKERQKSEATFGGKSRERPCTSCGGSGKCAKCGGAGTDVRSCEPCGATGWLVNLYQARKLLAHYDAVLRSFADSDAYFAERSKSLVVVRGAEKAALGCALSIGSTNVVAVPIGMLAGNVRLEVSSPRGWRLGFDRVFLVPEGDLALLALTLSDSALFERGVRVCSPSEKEAPGAMAAWLACLPDDGDAMPSASRVEALYSGTNAIEFVGADLAGISGGAVLLAFDGSPLGVAGNGRREYGGAGRVRRLDRLSLEGLAEITAETLEAANRLLMESGEALDRLERQIAEAGFAKDTEGLAILTDSAVDELRKIHDTFAWRRVWPIPGMETIAERLRERASGLLAKVADLETAGQKATAVTKPASDGEAAAVMTSNSFAGVGADGAKPEPPSGTTKAASASTDAKGCESVPAQEDVTQDAPDASAELYGFSRLKQNFSPLLLAILACAILALLFWRRNGPDSNDFT